MAEEQINDETMNAEAQPEAAQPAAEQPPSGGEPPVATANEDGSGPPTNPNMKWYIIHSYSGFERKVK